MKRYKQTTRYNRYIGLKRLYRLSVWHQVQQNKDIKEIWNVPEPPWWRTMLAARIHHLPQKVTQSSDKVDEHMK